MSLDSRISLIAALGKNRELGFQGTLLWHLPDDLRHFKELTDGHAVVMGRKTWESLPVRFRPLPNRLNIIVTRSSNYVGEGATVTTSIEEALAAARKNDSREIFVIGGSELYRETLPLANRLYLTLVDASAHADVYFPEYENEFKLLSKRDGKGVPPHSFCVFERI